MTHITGKGTLYQVSEGSHGVNSVTVMQLTYVSCMCGFGGYICVNKLQGAAGFSELEFMYFVGENDLVKCTSLYIYNFHIIHKFAFVNISRIEIVQRKTAK